MAPTGHNANNNSAGTVLKITATGTPEEARAKVQEYIKRGATCPILYPLGDVRLMIDTFATK